MKVRYLKPLLQRLSQSESLMYCISRIIAFIMRFSYATTRWTVINKDIPDRYHEDNEPFIICHWHDRLMTTPCVWKWKNPLHVLASNHRDGRLIATVVENFSMIPVFGSTGKGMIAVRNLIRLIKEKKYVAIIPDGPRGPRHQVAPGAVAIAKITKTDILPYSCCVKKYFRFNSWDRFIFVWPFNRGVMVWGKPITYEEIENLQTDEATKLVENRINEATQQAKEVLYGENL